MGFNSRLKKVRDSVGLSTRAFGEKVGYTGATVSLIENAKKSYSDPDKINKYILAVCSQFGISEHWVRTGEGEMLDASRNQEMQRRITTEEHLLAVYAELPPELQASVRRFALSILADAEKKEKNS